MELDLGLPHRSDLERYAINQWVVSNYRFISVRTFLLRFHIRSCNDIILCLESDLIVVSFSLLTDNLRCPGIFAKEINSNSDPPGIVIRLVWASTRKDNLPVKICQFLNSACYVTHIIITTKLVTSIYYGRNRRVVSCFNKYTSHVTWGEVVAKNQKYFYNKTWLKLPQNWMNQPWLVILTHTCGHAY